MIGVWDLHIFCDLKELKTLCNQRFLKKEGDLSKQYMSTNYPLHFRLKLIFVQPICRPVIFRSPLNAKQFLSLQRFFLFTIFPTSTSCFMFQIIIDSYEKERFSGFQQMRTLTQGKASNNIFLPLKIFYANIQRLLSNSMGVPSTGSICTYT